MAPRILCVAEKPSIAKSVAQHLAGGQVQVVRSDPGSGLLFMFILIGTSAMSQVIDMSRITTSIMPFPNHGGTVLLR